MKPKLQALFAAMTVAFLTTASASDTRVVTLDVKGMDCGTCPLTVKILLRKQDGVREVTVDRKTAQVRYEPAKVDEERLVKVVSDAGYPATARK